MDEIQDERHTDWYWSDNEIIDVYGPKVGAYAIAVYSFLARYANNKTGRTCFPSHKTIAEGLNISRSTVVRALEKLEEAGLIKVTVRSSVESGRPETSNVYKLMPVKKDRKDTPYVPQTHPVSPIDTPPIPTDIPPVSQGNTPYVPQTYKQDESNKTKGTRARESAPAIFPNQLAVNNKKYKVACKVAEMRGKGGKTSYINGIIEDLTEEELAKYDDEGNRLIKVNGRPAPVPIDRSGFSDPAFLAKKEKLFKDKGIPV